MKNFMGFTLVELLITIGIMGILTAAIIPSFDGFGKRQALTNASESLRSDISSAQNKAVSGVAVLGAKVDWGLEFASSCDDAHSANSYNLGYFNSGGTFVSQSQRSMSPAISIFCSSNNTRIRFERMSGKLIGAISEYTYLLENNSGDTKSLSIGLRGQVSIN